MKIILIFLSVFILGCSHKSKSSDNNNDKFKTAKEKGDFYLKNLSDNIYVRCDKLAFLPYVSFFEAQDLSGFEDNGKWGRDYKDKKPCYPDESRGSISFDGLISVLHHIWSTKDKAMLDRLISYGEKNHWIVGEGEYSNQILIKPIAMHMKHKLENALFVYGVVDDSILSGFRGHLLASYIWLMSRMDGEINEVKNLALKELLKASATDPMYLSLYDKHNSGNQDRALDILTNDNIFKMEKMETTGLFGWGSSPDMIYYLISLAIIEPSDK